MSTFKDLELNTELATAIDKLGFDTPTEIQERTMPLIVKGEDVIGESATGSGKTLAFGSAVFEKTQKGKGIQSLIITPTRELADQVAGMIKDLTRSKKFNIMTIYGGVSIDDQMRRLSGADVVVATPGRLKDYLQRHNKSMPDRQANSFLYSNLASGD